MRFNQFTRTRYYIKNCDWELGYSKERERGLPCLISEIRRLSLTRSSAGCGCEWHDQCDKSYPNGVKTFFIFRSPQLHFGIIHLMTYIFRVSMRLLGLWQLQISSVTPCYFEFFQNATIYRNTGIISFMRKTKTHSLLLNIFSSASIFHDLLLILSN